MLSLPSPAQAPAAVVVAATLLLAGAAAPETAAGWTWPVVGEVAAPFSVGADRYAAGQHRGIDIAARVGTPVVAATAGTVRFAGTVGSSGLTVSIRTADGRFDTSYLHLSTAAVAAGTAVAAGAPIGAVGASGRPSSSTPHLHFGVRDAGTRRYRDPLAFLPPRPGVRDLPRGAPAPVRVPVGPTPRPVRARRAPRPLAARRVRRPFPLGRAPAPHRLPLPVPRPPRAAWPGAPRVESAASDRRGWAVACGALLAATALLGAGSRRGRRRSGAALRAARRLVLPS